MQHQGYYRALPAANLRRLIFLRSLVFFDVPSNEVKNDYSTLQKQQRRLDVL